MKKLLISSKLRNKVIATLSSEDIKGNFELIKLLRTGAIELNIEQFETVATILLKDKIVIDPTFKPVPKNQLVLN